MKISDPSESETVHENGEIIEFGRCYGCLRPSKLVDHACDGCRNTFGVKCGVLFKRLRENQEFFIKFLKILPFGKRMMILSLFGLPSDYLSLLEKHSRGSHLHLCVASSTPTQNPQDSNS